MPRSEREWLQDILDAANEVQSYDAAVDFETFVAESMRRNATLQQLTVIGEAAAQLPPEVRDRHAEIEWTSIIGFRNVIVHGYFRMTWPIVWETATTDMPALIEQISALLADESSPPADGPSTPET
ncbi:MAG TPA: DUF86 domain-containing protein [Thermomicrobiales bacterium]|jgi:uncharacterized protein with HEPN domain